MLRKGHSAEVRGRSEVVGRRAVATPTAVGAPFSGRDSCGAVGGTPISDAILLALRAVAFAEALEMARQRSVCFAVVARIQRGVDLVGDGARQGARGSAGSEEDGNLEHHRLALVLVCSFLFIL